VTTNLARTFYSGFQNGATTDRRQPLPSTFAARWISGGPGAFNTEFTVWREAPDSFGACTVWPNKEIPLTELIRFDEDENPVSSICAIGICVEPRFKLPATSRINAADTAVFPPNPDVDAAGWMYFNLNSEREGYSSNWVYVTMTAHGRFSTDIDASALGNGCSPAPPPTAEDGGPPVIGPSPNGN
jgi:hypothetical protein